jgi:hypothetical protein
MPIAAIRPATHDDLLAFYGKDRIGPSFKGIAGTLDGKVVAVAGLAYVGGRVFAFCSVKDDARPYRVHIHRTAKRILDEAKRRHRFIYADCDPNELGAAKWLARLGFEHLDGNLWRLSSA